MRIELEIPKEFEEHFNQDKFKDSLERIMVDIKQYLEIGNCLCAGNYEYETIEMLAEALENSKPAYDIDKVVEELEKCSWIFKAKMLLPNSTEIGGEYGEEVERIMICIQDAIEIVKQGGVSDDVCECRELKYCNSALKTSCGYIYMFGIGKEFKYCPYCGRKIKVIQNDN